MLMLGTFLWEHTHGWLLIMLKTSSEKLCSTRFMSLYLHEELMKLLIFTGGSDILDSVSVLMYPWEYFG